MADAHRRTLVDGPEKTFFDTLFRSTIGYMFDEITNEILDENDRIVVINATSSDSIATLVDDCESFQETDLL